MIGIPSPDRLWQRHERLILNVLVRALVKLRKSKTLPTDEVPLNDYLYTYMREVWCRLPLREKPNNFSLVPNSENPPRVRGEIGLNFTRKKPDFQWILSDPAQKDPIKAVKNYTIECKRLGDKTASGWNLLKEYVGNGIVRFLSEEHSYGRGATSGAMIGYIQNMELDDILSQINQVIDGEKKYQIPAIVFYPWRNSQDKIEEGSHALARKFTPLSFILHHFWVDLRN